jgi:hypothetical protein
MGRKMVKTGCHALSVLPGQVVFGGGLLWFANVRRHFDWLLVERR